MTTFKWSPSYWIEISFTSQNSTIKLLRKVHLYFSSPEASFFNLMFTNSLTVSLWCNLKSQNTVIESPGYKQLKTLCFIDDKAKELEFVFESGFLDCKPRDNHWHEYIYNKFTRSYGDHIVSSGSLSQTYIELSRTLVMYILSDRTYQLNHPKPWLTLSFKLERENCILLTWKEESETQKFPKL